ncbi:HAMP domain-containing sensor histidine kinase [[Clostridium] symbiosum]|uniref:sensor histidine kinase n=1 Tax=Clostridium symbiosum TaxID=1512 RepID=UPI001D06F8A5|nr:HAMP domain-containing sensor histidine kinase [[Clostridium] symbiosum]MCB6607571.1 HAMP domain-containing histidine kinase [[Clostridium] symbiosum]MCB6930683.1 HAMP domain-containing histidine kinase [[Clostridium] symbiosum]
MKKKRFHLPQYWFFMLILIFITLSVMPLMAGFLVNIIANGEERKIRFLQFNPFFPSLIFLLSSVFISFGISLWLWFKVLVPLGNISQAAKQVAKGDFTIQVEAGKSLGELRELTDNFNRMVQELGSIESFRNDFVTNISHEFKTPLAAIEGYATLLQEPSLSEEDKNEYIRIIMDSTKQLSSMAGNILMLSRLEKQEIITGQSNFKLDEQIRQALLMLEPLWEKKHLDLDIDLPPVRYFGNADLLMQVWLNLFQNAVKFTPAGGSIAASMQVLPESVEITISDTGIGMDENTMRRVFEKFYSANKELGRSGNGLGLSITKRIVELSGGTISVESRVDEGSCFKVILPRVLN